VFRDLEMKMPLYRRLEKDAQLLEYMCGVRGRLCMDTSQAADQVRRRFEMSQSISRFNGVCSRDHNAVVAAGTRRGAGPVHGEAAAHSDTWTLHAHRMASQTCREIWDIPHDHPTENEPKWRERRSFLPTRRQRRLNRKKIDARIVID